MVVKFSLKNVKLVKNEWDTIELDRFYARKKSFNRHLPFELKT